MATDFDEILRRISGRVNLDNMDTKTELQLSLDDFFTRVDFRGPPESRNNFDRTYAIKNDKYRGERNRAKLIYSEPSLKRLKKPLADRMRLEKSSAEELERRYNVAIESRGKATNKKEYARFNKRSQRARNRLESRNLIALTNLSPVTGPSEGRKYANQPGYRFDILTRRWSKA